VFENRVLRRILGPKRDEVTGDWKKLHCKELYNCTRGSRNQEDTARMEDIINAYKILVEET
jgi:hypothetical protein